MVSPTGETPTYAKDNKNGFLSSLLAWIRGSKVVIGGRDLPGFYVWDANTDADLMTGLPDSCKTSLTQLVGCDSYARLFLAESYRGSLGNDTLTESVCDESCGVSLKRWFDNVASDCKGYNVSDSAATKYGGQIWSGWNETCLKDTRTGEYCNGKGISCSFSKSLVLMMADLISEYPAVDFLDDMPESEICSFCFVERLGIMQRSSYSFYDEGFQDQLGTVNAKCGLSVPTAKPPSLDAPPEFLPDPICISNQTYQTVSGDTCDSIALRYNVSSASLVMANNRQLMVCNDLTAEMDLCIPSSCASTYTLKSNDTCTSIESSGLRQRGDVRKYNSWVEWDCSNLQTSTDFWGHIICLGVQGGTYTATASIPGVTLAPEESTGYTNSRVAPPANATAAEGTTLKCGKWRVAVKGETCAQICLQESITSSLFVGVNPSLASSNCSDGLIVGNAYCVGPNPGWSFSNSTTSLSTQGRTPGSSSMPVSAAIL